MNAIRRILCLLLAAPLLWGAQCDPGADGDVPAPEPDASRVLQLVTELRRHVAAGRTDTAVLDPLTNELHAELQRVEADCRAMRRENERLRQALEQWSQSGRVADIDIRFYTRLVDDNGDGLADKLVAAMTPRDAVGNPIRTPGEIALELTRKNMLGGAGKVLQTWTFEPEQAATHWRGEAVVFPGYEFTLPLDESTRENLGRGAPVLRVTFEPTGGEAIRAERTVKGVSR